MNILALDIATKTGYAHSNGVSGTWNMSSQRNESETMRLLRLRSKLDMLRAEFDIDLVVFEAAHVRFVSAARPLIELQTVVKLWCDDRKIPYDGNIKPTTIKKHATGSGSANKMDMFESARIKWPDVKLIDDNHADALHLLDYAKKLYGSN